MEAKHYKIENKANVISRRMLSLGDYNEREVREMGKNILDNNASEEIDLLYMVAYQNVLDEQCQELSRHVHMGQFRRGKNADPFFEHPYRVAENFRGDSMLYGVALLHDTIEDTDMTEEKMLDTIIPSIVEKVVRLTHLKEESYWEYLEKVKECPLCTRVKLMDILDNISDDPTENQTAKYRKAVLFLSE